MTTEPHNDFVQSSARPRLRGHPGAFDKVLKKITKAPQTHAQRGAQSHHPVTSQLSKALAAPIL
jgi:hypothetical protein